MPATTSSLPSPALPAGETLVPRQSTRSLLLVEDEAVLAMDLSEQLQDMGYLVCAIADRGDLALELAERHRPDLVLMDIVIKGEMDGVQTSERMARELHIPVVFLTAHGDAASLKRAVDTAPYGYVTKPYKPPELRAAIEVALSKSRLERALRESEQRLAGILRCLGEGVVATDGDGRIQFVNQVAQRTLQRTSVEACGTTLESLVRIQDFYSGEAIESPIARALGPFPVEMQGYAKALVLPDGARIAVDLSAVPIRDEHDAVIGAVLAFRDIRDRLAIEEALRSSEERLRSIFDLSPTGIMLLSLYGRFLECNPAMLALLECSVDDLRSLTHEDVTHVDDLAEELHHLKRLLDHPADAVHFDKRYRRRGGGYVRVQASVSLLTGRDRPVRYLYQVRQLAERH